MRFRRGQITIALAAVLTALAVGAPVATAWAPELAVITNQANGEECEPYYNPCEIDLAGTIATTNTLFGIRHECTIAYTVSFLENGANFMPEVIDEVPDGVDIGSDENNSCEYLEIGFTQPCYSEGAWSAAMYGDEGSLKNNLAVCFAVETDNEQASTLQDVTVTNGELSVSWPKQWLNANVHLEGSLSTAPTENDRIKVEILD